MGGKVKMRCAQCGKRFTASGNKQTLCQECAAKQRQAKSTSKLVPPTRKPTKAAAPRITGPGASLLAPGIPITRTEAPPDTGLFGAAARNAERAGEREHGEPRVTRETREHRPHEGATGQTGPSAATATPTQRSERGDHAKPSQAPARKPQRPPAPPFEVTDALREKIEARYLELANPVEFDGIRTQIARELEVPKGAVKRVVAELRARMQIPSWWELQGYQGDEATLERIRAVYEPLLPVPPVGIHKRIAADLEIDPAQVYQGIRRIRAEMHLPRYNPPELHADGAPVMPGAQAVADHGASQ